jgi:SAM-dependent methyltransferase
VTFDNPFVARNAATRYHRGRPYHHERTLAWALDLAPVARGHGLDIACGTGLSTRALAALGFDPIGLDVAAAMVELARVETGLPFIVSTAEDLPVETASCALVTVASGVHWFDRTAFYDEAARVLAPGGLLLLSEHAGAHLPDNPEFVDWVRGTYVQRYPAPPRGAPAGHNDDAPTLFESAITDHRLDLVSFTHAELVDYLLTQSTVADAIDGGSESEEAVREWLFDQTAGFFSSAEEPLQFAFFASIQCLYRGSG